MAFAPGVPNNQGGRKKGCKNRNPQKVISMILRSLDQVGGTKYLVRMAEEKPASYLALLGKVIPKQQQVSGTVNIEQSVLINDSKDWLAQQISALSAKHPIEHQPSQAIDITPEYCGTEVAGPEHQDIETEKRKENSEPTP